MKKGFTLVEMLTVVSIIGIVSVISVPLLLNYQKTSKLKNEARALATNLRLTQQLAITEQSIYDLKLFDTLGKYQIINTDTTTVVKEVVLDSEIDINSVTGLTNDTAEFNPTGAVLETGFIYLTNSRGETSTIELKPSGYVQLTE